MSPTRQRQSLPVNPRQCAIYVLAVTLLNHATSTAQAQLPASRDPIVQLMKTDYARWASAAPKRDLLVEFDPNPLAIGVSNPRFSWIVPLDGRGRKQAAYRIRVATRPELLESARADMWDSGFVASEVSTNVPYAGLPLKSNTDYFWNVQVQDEAGKPQPTSRTARFGTALLKDSDWKARWIGRGSTGEVVADVHAFISDKQSPQVKAFEPNLSSPLFRKEFAVANPVRRARLYVSGMGLYEVRLNGKKVGDHVLTPPKTEYRKRVPYDTYDVTTELKNGENAIGILLGNGWFNTQKRHWGWQMQWYGSPRAILQLEIQYADGSTARVVTDDTWKSSQGPIGFNCLYDGEDYDARQEQPGWDMPGFDASRWQPANLVASPGGKLVPATVQSGVVVETLRPISITKLRSGIYVYDLGRNISGWVRLRVRGPRDTLVRLRFAEAVKSDGSLDRTTVMHARAEDNYVLRGDGDEVYEPRFTYHGFRYVEVAGFPGEPTLDAIEGRFVHTEAAPAGFFECSDDEINRIHLCTVETQRMILQMGVPTDCPQRPERLGWGGDSLVSAEEAMLNLDLPRLYAKWMADFVDSQTPSGVVGMIVPRAGLEEDLVWSAAYPSIVWRQYLHYGDRRLLETHYASLVRYMSYLATQGRADLLPWTWTPGTLLITPPKGPLGHLQQSQWGDHLSFVEGWKCRDGQPRSISTAYYFHDVTLMERIARALGKSQDADKYRQLADDIKTAFNNKFFDAKRGCYEDGSQAAQAFAISLGLVPSDKMPAVVKTLIDDIFQTQRGHLTTGLIGTSAVVHALAAIDRADLVWRLATVKTYPGWQNMLQGMTTAKEWWGGGSYSHVVLAAPIDAWFYTGLAGIRLDEQTAGFEQVVIKPYIPDDLDWVNAWVDAVRGRVAVSWRKEKGLLHLDVMIPANTAAVVHLPARALESVQENGAPAATSKSIHSAAIEKGSAVLHVGSGQYHFTTRLP